MPVMVVCHNVSPRSPSDLSRASVHGSCRFDWPDLVIRTGLEDQTRSEAATGKESG
jgi:hypothetical protein